MFRLFFYVALTLITTIGPVNAQACPEGSGGWVLSSGVVECRPCPTDNLPPVDAALKMPKRCLAPFAGALLDVDFYQDLKNARDYAEELESWKLQLSPTLEKLQTRIDETVAQFEASRDYNTQLLLDIKELEAKKDKYVLISAVTGGSLAILLTFVVVSHAVQ